MTDSRFGPDSLDDLWDEFVSRGRSTPSSGTAQFLAQLEQEAPMLTQSQHDRIRRLVQFPPASETAGALAAPSPLAAGPATLPRPSRPLRIPKRRVAEHPALQIAATILLLLGIVSVWLVIRPGDTKKQSLPGAAVSSPVPNQSSTPPFLMSIEVPPAVDAQTPMVFIRQIELAPGARWEIPTEFQGSDSFIVRRFLDSGTVLVETANGTHFSPDDASPLDSSSGNPAAVENTGESSAMILELIASTTRTSLPELPAGSRVVHQSILGYQIRPGEGTTFVLARVADPSEYQPGVNSATHPVVQALVESGSYTFTPNDGTTWANRPIASTPVSGDTQLLNEGESLHIEPGSFPEMHAEGDDASLLLLGARTITTAEIAQRGETAPLTAPEYPLHLDVRTVTIAPGGSYSYTMSGASIAWGVSGSAGVASSAATTATISLGLFTTWSDSSTVTLANTGNEPAVFVLGRISSTPIADEAIDATTFTQTASSDVTYPGSVLARLSLDAVDGRRMQIDDQSVSLVLVIDGGLQLRALSNMSVHIAGDSVALTAFGDPVSLSAGDWFFAGPGANYETSGADADTQVMSLELDPDPMASGIATPESATGTQQAGTSIDVFTSDCTIEPRSTEEYERILATPVASDPTINHPGDSGTPADPAVVDAVTETMRQVVACNPLDAPDRHYALYSPAMLRFLSSSGSFDLSELSDTGAERADSSGNRPAGQLYIGEVTEFPDGRAGAWIVAHGEIAHVTFVNVNGQWLVDSWDDSAMNATPVP
jgi:hypothetical protein